MYSGYIEAKDQRKCRKQGELGIHSYHERQFRAFERHLDAYWHLQRLGSVIELLASKKRDKEEVTYLPIGYWRGVPLHS